jgi:hypothetical protein
MINSKDHPLGWVSLLYELEDAHEHLGNLVKNMVSDPEYSDVEFRIDLAHVYAHLNRAWYRRNVPEDIPKELWDKATQFPSDIEPLA